MRAKEEGGLATYYVFLVGGECVRRGVAERAGACLTSHSPAMHTRTETAAGSLACARGNVCMRYHTFCARYAMVHSNPTNYLTVRPVVMMRNKNGLEPLNWS